MSTLVTVENLVQSRFPISPSELLSDAMEMWERNRPMLAALAARSALECYVKEMDTGSKRKWRSPVRRATKLVASGILRCDTYERIKGLWGALSRAVHHHTRLDCVGGWIQGVSDLIENREEIQGSVSAATAGI
jgi:hypothetical protein